MTKTSNARCPLCGCEISDSHYYESKVLHPENNCVLSKFLLDRVRWNTRHDPLQSKVEEFCKQMQESFPYDMDHIQDIYNKLFGDSADGE